MDIRILRLHHQVDAVQVDVIAFEINSPACVWSQPQINKLTFICREMANDSKFTFTPVAFVCALTEGNN